MKRTWIVAVVLAALIAAPVLAQDTDEPSRPAVPLTEAQQRQSIRQLTALFIITLLVLLVMILSMVVFTLFLRRRIRALEEERPRLPTELEDLWWKMNMPERQGDKKDRPSS